MMSHPIRLFCDGLLADESLDSLDDGEWERQEHIDRWSARARVDILLDLEGVEKNPEAEDDE